MIAEADAGATTYCERVADHRPGSDRRRDPLDAIDQDQVADARGEEPEVRKATERSPAQRQRAGLLDGGNVSFGGRQRLQACGDRSIPRPARRGRARTVDERTDEPVGWVPDAELIVGDGPVTPDDCAQREIGRA